MRWLIFGEMFYIRQFFINSVIDLMTSKISHGIKLLLLVKNDLESIINFFNNYDPENGLKLFKTYMTNYYLKRLINVNISSDYSNSN